MMKLSNKGVSLITLAITIIVIVIIAGIALSSGFVNVDKAQQVVFLTDLESAVDSLRIYNERGALYGKRDFNKNLLRWDGKEDSLTNSAKLDYLENDFEGKKVNPKYPNEDEKAKILNAPEDTPAYVFNGQVPNTLKGKIYIQNGVLYVYEQYQEEYSWATQKYEYMSNH